MTQRCGRMDRQMAKLTMQVWSKLRFKDLLIFCDFSHFEYCFLKNIIKTHPYFITITFKKTIFFSLIYLRELQDIISSGFNEVVWLLFWFQCLSSPQVWAYIRHVSVFPVCRCQMEETLNGEHKAKGAQPFTGPGYTTGYPHFMPEIVTIVQWHLS